MNSTPFNINKLPTDTDCPPNFIPSIHTQPVKFLGHISDGSLNDRKCISELERELLSCLKIIDRSLFKGAQKLWILQHLLVPRIQWPLMIYEISISAASNLEKKISTYIRKWLGLHSSTTNISLYSSCSPCPLPVKKLTTVLKSSKLSGHLLLRDSQDPLIVSSCPKCKFGQGDAGSEAELTYQKIRGPVEVGRSGLGSSKQLVILSKKRHAYRSMIYSIFKELPEEETTL